LETFIWSAAALLPLFEATSTTRYSPKFNCSS
jgi:hypothetical protein